MGRLAENGAHCYVISRHFKAVIAGQAHLFAGFRIRYAQTYKFTTIIWRNFQSHGIIIDSGGYILACFPPVEKSLTSAATLPFSAGWIVILRFDPVRPAGWSVMYKLL